MLVYKMMWEPLSRPPRFAIQPAYGGTLFGVPPGTELHIDGRVRQLAGEHHSVFMKAQQTDTQYQDFLKDLVDDELELAELGARLAVDAGLVDRITAIVARARGNTPDSLPPDIDTLLSTDDPNWPRDAVLFVLVTWLRFGLRELLEGFAVLEDSNPFDGKFKLADLLRIAGLDVSLDDQTAASLKTVFAETTATAGARAGG